MFQSFRDPAQEACCVGAVNQPMIVGERKRQNFARLEGAAGQIFHWVFHLVFHLAFGQAWFHAETGDA